MAAGDTTPWFASFWEFCARYCDFRFGKDWHLSPEQSLLLHAEDTVIPKQVIVYSPKGTNNTIKLLFRTSLYDLKSKMPPAASLLVKDGLRMFKPANVLVRISEDFMRRQPAEVHVLLAGIKDASEILAPFSTAATPWLRDALRAPSPHRPQRHRRGNRQDHEERRSRCAAHDPFAEQQTFGSLKPGVSPIVGRIQSFWSMFRDEVTAAFPKPPGLPKDQAAI